MVSARNLLRRHYDSYGGFDADVDDDRAHCKHPYPLTSNPIIMMDQQQENQEEEEEEEEEEEVGTSTSTTTSSKQQQPVTVAAADDSWLQLSIGMPTSPSAEAGPSSYSGPLRTAELELFERRSHVTRPAATTTTTSYRPPSGYWNYSNPNFNLMMMPHYYHPHNVGRLPFHLPPSTLSLPLLPPMQMGHEGSGSHFGAAGFRVVGPPERRHQQTGLWFLLKAAENQVREPFLPQIPKSYIRIKDGRMTVRLLMKYLVNKLGLGDESEVQITCRGQPLIPLLTLHHVRNNIWCLNQELTLHPDSPSTDHVMTLQYGRSP